MDIQQLHVIVLAVLSIGLGAGLYIHYKVINQDVRSRDSCPCDDVKYCERIQDTTRKEIFIFSLNAKKDDWRFYDWDKVTTVVMVGYVDMNLVCYAHKYGARAITIGSVSQDVLLNKSARTVWIQEQLDFVEEHYLDGINFDYESAMLKNQTDLVNGYTDLVRETKMAFSAKFPQSLVSVDVAWSPAGIDLRYYDYTGLAQASDYLFVMAYDEQSQILGKCIAGANSGFPRAMEGILGYLDLGIPSDKLILGVPWYGYIYECLELTKDNECYIRKVPFRGVACSDAAGRQINYSYIIQLLKNSTSDRLYDNTAMSPYFNYKNASSDTYFQIRYDDPASLTLKYMYAIDQNLRGVGIWNAECVNYTSGLPDDIKARDEMWKAFPVYK
ncbi:hypothetical protein ACF0H5_016385 [Mactra antiquata]